MAGRPYTVETAFSSWLQLFLQYADPSKKWEVVNCGGVSYASYRLVPILEEVLENYTPDLVILYTGQNEFLEDRTYAHLKNLPLSGDQTLCFGVAVAALQCHPLGLLEDDRSSVR